MDVTRYSVVTDYREGSYLGGHYLECERKRTESVDLKEETFRMLPSFSLRNIILTGVR